MEKPLGGKSYGSIPHLPGSRMGSSDRNCLEGEGRIACDKKRDEHDRIIVQEKLDGSNVGVALKDSSLYAMGRSGYIASTSKYVQHQLFAVWVRQNYDRFRAVLSEGERVCGEWLIQAHGTKYRFEHEPFVAFDIMTGIKRVPFDAFNEKISKGEFITPHVVSDGDPISIEKAMAKLGTYGKHGALEPVEGAVWRIERDKLVDKKMSFKRASVVDFLVKYVRPDKVDGCYLGGKEIYNEYPNFL